MSSSTTGEVVRRARLEGASTALEFTSSALESTSSIARLTVICARWVAKRLETLSVTMSEGVLGEAPGVDAGGEVKGDDSRVELAVWVGEESMFEAVKITALVYVLSAGLLVTWPRQ